MSCSFTNQVLAQILLFKAEDEAFGKRYIEFGKTGKKEIGVYVLPKILDEQVALLHLEHVNAKLSKLTEAQAEYVSLPVEGPFKHDQYASPPLLAGVSINLISQIPILNHLYYQSIGARESLMHFSTREHESCP